jgi:hypothetical protein
MSNCRDHGCSLAASDFCADGARIPLDGTAHGVGIASKHDTSWAKPKRNHQLDLGKQQ